jgi:hypothetical protein
MNERIRELAVVARIIENQSHKVVDFFEKNVN